MEAMRLAVVWPSLGETMRSPSEEYIIELYQHAAELYHRHGYKPFFDARVLRNPGYQQATPATITAVWHDKNAWGLAQRGTEPTF